MKSAFLETWTESEQGWGQKPDGGSLHLTKTDYENYVKDFWKDKPNSAPSIYERPDSNLREIVVSDALFNTIKESKYGIRLWQSELKELKAKNEILFKN